MKLNQNQRIQQLQNASDLLLEALEKVESGDYKYLVVLGSQLRALICTGGRNFKPLLFEISEELNMPIECFGPQNIDPTSDLYKGLVFHIGGRLIGSEPFSPAQVKYFLKDWLNANILTVDGQSYTPNEVLRLFADKEASHYDADSDAKMDKLRTITHHNYFKGKNINEIERFLIQTANFVVECTKELLANDSLE